MLPEILKSKYDSAVLGFFLVAPKRAFSIDEVSKQIRVTVMKGAFAMNRLASAGLLKSFSKRGKKYFMLNTKYAALADAKRQIKSGFRYGDNLLFSIKHLGDIRAAFLSGIFTGQPNLPVDVLLVGRVHLKKLADFLKTAEKLMGQDVNYSIMTESEFSIRRDTFDKFIKDIFDYPHLVVCDRLGKK